MQYELLGVDETRPGLPFLRWVNPTEIDKTAVEMSRIIKGYYPGWDLLNISLWRKLGTDVGNQSNPLQQFLQHYMQVARENRRFLDESNVQWWIDTLHNRYETRIDDLTDYLNAMLDMIRAGKMSDTILKPYTYEPTEVGEDFSRKVFPRLVVAAAVIGGVMVLSNTLLPQVATAVAKTRKTRRKRR